MSTEVLEKPVVAPVDDDHITHTVCCDRDRALCGVDVSGANDRPPGVYPDDCVFCEHVAITAKSCGARFCRLRSWWRDRGVR